MKYKALIVDDERNPRDRLRELLREWDHLVEVLGEADNGPDAVREIKQLRPDILFLDIRLPGMDGFEVIHNLDSQPVIIFTTAYHEHALEAFATNSIDYLLKPIRSEDLGRALNKLVGMERRAKDGGPEGSETRILSQLKEILAPPAYQAIIPCKSGDKTHFVKTSEIMYFNSDSRYTFVHTGNGKKLILDTPLVDLEKRINPREFLRIRRGTIVNIAWILEVRRIFNGRMKVILLDKQATELMASRMYSDNLRNL